MSPLARQGARRAHNGYLLLPVSLMLAAIAAAAYAIIVLEGVAGHSAVQTREAREVELVAEAGLAHARIAASAGTCSNYALPTQPFGRHSYSATYTPTSGSPVEIEVTGTLASGAQATEREKEVTVYEGANATLVLQPDPATSKDVSIYSVQPTKNYGVSDSMFAGGPYVGFLEFDLSGLPPTSIVRRATLELMVTWGWAGNFEIRQATADWEEGSCSGTGPLCVADGANWVTRDGLTPWASSGGDYGARVWSEQMFTTTGAKAIDVTSLVAAWHDGMANHGMAFVMSSGAEAEIVTGEHATAEYRPKLTIEFACECDPASSGGQVVLQPGAGVGKDTMVLGGSQGDKNYGANSSVWVDDGPPNLGLFEFDLAGLPANAIVTNASLDLYNIGVDTLDSGVVAVYRITSPWTEGSGGSSGLLPADGANRNTTDGLTPWLTPPADYDPTVIDSVEANVLTPQWYTWDVTDLVAGWDEGTFPNHGLLIRAISGLVNKWEIASSDNNDATLHPKLTIDYICPCGMPCGTPIAVGENLLIIVTDEFAPTSEELAVEALIESWGFVVTRLAQIENQSVYDAALVGQDVVFVSAHTSASNVGSHLSAARIGVVFENAELTDEMSVATSVHWGSETALDVVDDAHYVTANLSNGNHVVLTVSESLASVDGLVSDDADRLADRIGEPAILALDHEGLRADKAGYVEGRRVQLPWGSAAHSSSHLTTAGQELLRRALEWASTPPHVHAGYLDRFENPVCDPAVDYTRSHGSLDWSAESWLESETLDACGGDSQIKQKLDGYRLEMGNGAEIERQVDLSGFAIASLQFRHETVGTFDNLHYLRVDASGNGGATWSEIGRIDTNHSEPWELVSYGLTPLIAADTRIRLKAVGFHPTQKIYVDDVALVEETTLGGTCLDNYLDSQLTAGYDRNNGSLLFTTDWIEVNESDGSENGDEQSGLKNGEYRLRVANKSGGGEGLMREADLSTAASAFLRFEYLREKFDDDSDYVSIQVSGDGGTSWFTLDTIGGAADDSDFTEALYPLDGYLAPNTRIRFLTSPSLGNKDKFHFDEIEICIQ